MNPNYLRDVIARDIAGHPKTVAEKLQRQINRGVFSNGQVNHAYQMDVFDFLSEVEGDILYLDPPYAGTSAYETSLKALDSMLEGAIVRPKPSVFSRVGAVEALEMLFEASGRFPVWVISYGNAEVDLETVVKVVERFKPVVAAESFRYTHLTGLSGDAHRRHNRELLIVAQGEK